MVTVTCLNVVENVSALEGMGMELWNLYQNNYLIVFVFLCLGIILPVVALFLGKLLRPYKPYDTKYTTYESGIEPFHDSRVQFNVRYYIFALMFVIFDVETVFLYPWAVAYEKLGIFALIEMLIFVFMLVIGLVYAWKKKVLKWI
ncbi:NADH-quinone oxidoreductase subunit A [Cytobacillus sp. NCCP-133]|nr:NADH-quinone oxidoreductase subunit A [Cytobacillus sp. NCCP-133]